MEIPPPNNRTSAAVVALIGAVLIGYPLVVGPFEMWGIYAVITGVLLIIVAVVLFVSTSPPEEHDLYGRGGGV